MTVYQVVHHLVSMEDQPVLESRVEIIAVAAVVREVQEPLRAYVRRLFLEELAVCAAQVIYHRTLPLPRAVLAREPYPRIDMLIDRESADRVHEERQDPELRDRILQIIYCSDVQIIDRHFFISIILAHRECQLCHDRVFSVDIQDLYGHWL